jgi:curved DNA-binding protein CbpA
MAAGFWCGVGPALLRGGRGGLLGRAASLCTVQPLTESHRVLGVQPGATPAQISRAYLERALRHNRAARRGRGAAAAAASRDGGDAAAAAAVTARAHLTELARAYDALTGETLPTRTASDGRPLALGSGRSATSAALAAGEGVVAAVHEEQLVRMPAYVPPPLRRFADWMRRLPDLWDELLGHTYDSLIHKLLREDSLAEVRAWLDDRPHGRPIGQMRCTLRAWRPAGTQTHGKANSTRGEREGELRQGEARGRASSSPRSRSRPRRSLVPWLPSSFNLPPFPRTPLSHARVLTAGLRLLRGDEGGGPEADGRDVRDVDPRLHARDGAGHARHARRPADPRALRAGARAVERDARAAVRARATARAVASERAQRRRQCAHGSTRAALLGSRGQGCVCACVEAARHCLEPLTAPARPSPTARAPSRLSRVRVSAARRARARTASASTASLTSS